MKAHIRFAARHIPLGIAVTLLGAVAVGCGTQAGIHSAHATHGKQLRAELMKAMSSWQETSSQVVDVVRQAGHPVRQLRLNLVSASHPQRYALTVNQDGHRTLTIVDDGRSTVSYTAGSSHYQVLSSLPPSSNGLRLMGIELPTLLASSTVHSVKVISDNRAVVAMTTPLPNGAVARAELWYNPVQNLPLAFSARWPGGNIQETIKRFAVNPALSSRVFHFRPPSGVTPQVVLSQTQTDLKLAQHSVQFPIVLPPTAANVTLDNVSVGRAKHAAGNAGTVVVLTYTAPDGTYLLVTERSLQKKTQAPPGVSLATENFGDLTVAIGVMPPFSEDFASFNVKSTEIWVQGQASAVQNLLNAWGSTVSSSGT